MGSLYITLARHGIRQSGYSVRIDKSSPRMAVKIDGSMRYDWPVSTGRSGHGTPGGVFHLQFSRKYYDASMPHAIFFHYGFAIHVIDNLVRLGGPEFGVEAAL